MPSSESLLAVIDLLATFPLDVGWRMHSPSVVARVGTMRSAGDCGCSLFAVAESVPHLVGVVRSADFVWASSTVAVPGVRLALVRVLDDRGCAGLVLIFWELS